MQVVELADGGGAGERHLEEGHAGDVVNLLRFEVGGGVVHGSAPGPEIFARDGARFRLAADEPLKAVRVDVDEARKERFAGQIDDRVGRRVGRGDAADLSIVADQEAAVANEGTVDEEEVRAIKSGHAATFSPRIQTSRTGLLPRV